MGTRLNGWEARLNDFLESRRNEPFAWGVNDCVTLAADAMESIYGVDPMWSFRGAYRDRKSALLLMARNGGLGRMVEALGVFREVRPSFAKRGDLVLIKDETGEETLRVAVGGGFVGPGEFGLSFVERVVIIKAFSLCPK